MGMRLPPDVEARALALAGLPPADVSEAEFQARVVAFAESRRWWCWHDTDSRKNRAGLPDLIMIRGGVLVFAELKSKGGRVRPAQAVVLGLLRVVAAASGGAVRVFTWRPADWAEIERVLGEQ